ncbi:MAG: hypothetical protein ACK4TL_05470 [Hyphomicrobiaceae bacterium]
MSLRLAGAGSALVVAGALFTSAQAAPVTGGRATKTLIDPHAMVQKTQIIVFRGRRWCFYWDAWNGPGWYWCGYAWRRGYGWGGGPGWHGWRYHSRDWHRRNRGWDRGGRPRIERGERRRWDGDRRGRAVEPRPRSQHRTFDGRSGGRESMSRGRSGGRESFGGRSGRSDSGRGASNGRGGRGGDGRGGGSL